MGFVQRMSFLGRLGPVSLLVAVAVLVAGCNEKVLDGTKTEEALRHNLEVERGEEVSSVECPSDQKVETGATFFCTAKLKDGSSERLTLKIVDNQADVHVIDVEAENARANE